MVGFALEIACLTTASAIAGLSRQQNMAAEQAENH
jgi:hypothetical protein